MPSDNEIKQLMTEKVFPFFEKGLEDILSRLENLEKLSGKALKALAERKAATEKMIKKMNDKVAKKAVAEHKAKLEKEKEAKRKKREQEESKPDVKATVKIDDTGRAELVEEITIT